MELVEAAQVLGIKMDDIQVLVNSGTNSYLHYILKTGWATAISGQKQRKIQRKQEGKFEESAKK